MRLLSYPHKSNLCSKYLVLQTSGTTKMSTLRKSRKAHITYGDSKRIITYNKGEAVEELRHHFLRVFSDELSDDVAPANVKFQRYHANSQDYEELTLFSRLP